MRSLRFVHRWLGILLALPLLFQGVSGAILTLEPVIPGFGVHGGGPVTSAASPNAIVGAARAVVPSGMRPSRYMPSEGPGLPARVQFVPEAGPRGPGWIVKLDPVTATPLGPAAPPSGVLEWVKRLHTTLLIPEWGGRQVIGWFGVGLLALSLLGLPLWWPSRTQRAAGRWRDGFTVPRGARGARLYRRLHGALGIWLWIMIVATSVTGIMQGFPQTSRAVLGVAGRLGGDGAGRNAPSQPLDLDAAIRLALDAVPGAELRMAMLPADGAEPVRVILGFPDTEGASSATTVLVDTAGPRVRSIQSPAQASAGETALRWAHDLHFGQGFGPVWRGLTVLVGTALPVFGVTGVLYWLHRRRQRRHLNDIRQAAAGLPSAGD